MRQQVFMLSALLLAASSTAQAEDTPSYQSDTSVKTDGKGNYKSTFEANGKNSDGTATHSSETKVAKTTWTGKKKYETTTESSTDPKGLGNKASKKETTTVTTDKDGDAHKKLSSSSVDAEGTKRTEELTAETTIGKDGKPETKVTDKTTKDPKGLFNKETSEGTAVAK